MRSKLNTVLAGWGSPLWLVILGLVLVASVLSLLRAPRPRPHVYRIPDDFPTIQEAIEQAPSMSAIVLRAGVYEENLKVDKTIFLLGTGAEKAVIRAAREAEPVIEIGGDAVVWIQDIEITGGSGGCAGGVRGEGLGSKTICPYGLSVGGRAQATLADVEVIDNALGIKVAERGQLRIVTSRISSNDGNGLEVRDSAGAIIEQSQLSANGGSGLWTISGGRVVIRDSEISDNGAEGLGAATGAKVVVEGSRIEGNGRAGVEVRGSARLTIEDVRIVHNGLDGLRLSEKAQAAVQGSLIEGNGLNEQCDEKLICSGITLAGQARLELQGSTIRENSGWGVTGVLTSCGFSHDLFSGRVSLEDNEITGNSRGEVCLPELCLPGEACD